MKKLVSLFSLFIVSSSFIFAANPGLQSIEGGFAFPAISKKNAVIARVNIHPKINPQQKLAFEESMNKLTVILCAAGKCKFAKANTGLGFYEANFQLHAQEFNRKSFDLQVVACSKLGCVQRTLTLKIIFPSNKF